ncbi:MAG TPA: hypothetical protein VNT99_17720 [Methylomirabilota bacterium]|nr:hypothetical protein [Methylomirabilota bacterium]
MERRSPTRHDLEHSGQADLEIGAPAFALVLNHPNSDLATLFQGP